VPKRTKITPTDNQIKCTKIVEMCSNAIDILATGLVSAVTKADLHVPLNNPETVFRNDYIEPLLQNIVAQKIGLPSNTVSLQTQIKNTFGVKIGGSIINLTQGVANEGITKYNNTIGRDR